VTRRGMSAWLAGDVAGTPKFSTLLQLEMNAMGHYDSSRPGYCAGCGAAPGNMNADGSCPFCAARNRAAFGPLTRELMKRPPTMQPNAAKLETLLAKSTLTDNDKSELRKFRRFLKDKARLPAAEFNAKWGAYMKGEE